MIIIYFPSLKEEQTKKIIEPKINKEERIKHECFEPIVPTQQNNFS